MSFDLNRVAEPRVIETKCSYKNKVADERGCKLAKCLLQKGNCKLGLAKSSSSNGHNDSEVNLDLELKTPCKPQPNFNWSDVNEGAYADIIDLTLSLVGNPVKREQRVEGSQETMNKESNLQKSGFARVEYKACEGDEPFKTMGPNNLVSDKDLNIKFDVDLNSVYIDSDDDTNPRNNSSKPLEVNEVPNEIAMGLVSQDQLADYHEAGHIELEQKELNAAKNHSEADEMDFVVLEGNKIAGLDNITKDNCSSFSKIDSDVVESSEEPEEYEEVLEEGSCNNEAGGSHCVIGADDAEIKEYEGVMEEVSYDDESDDCRDEYIDEETRKLMKMDGSLDQEVVRSMIPLQDDAQENHTQHLALDAQITTKKRLIKSGLDNDIAEPLRGKHVKTPQECIDKRECVVTRKAKRSWGTISGLDKCTADATEEIIMKQERGTKSGIDKNIAEASEKGKNEPGRWKIARRIYSSEHGGACKREKEKLNIRPNRPLYRNGKHDHERPIPSRIKREQFPNKSFRRDRSGRHRDVRCNDQYRSSDNDSKGFNQFAKRRSEYTWVRKDHGELDNAIECERTESRRGQMQNICDYQMPRAHEGKLLAHDLPGSGADQSSFSWPSPPDDIQRKRSELPNIVQNKGTQQYNYRSSSRSSENPSKAWLGAPQIFEHDKMQPSCQEGYYPHDSMVPSHAAAHEVAREIHRNGHRYSMPLTHLQRNIEQRRLDDNPRQTREKSFRYSQYIRGGERRSSAEFDEDYCGVENYPRPAQYDHGLHKEIERRNSRESERNIRNRLGETSNGARSAREKAGNSRFHGKKGWHDAEFSNAWMKRTKY